MSGLLYVCVCMCLTAVCLHLLQASQVQTLCQTLKEGQEEWKKMQNNRDIRQNAQQ